MGCAQPTEMLQVRVAKKGVAVELLRKLRFSGSFFYMVAKILRETCS